MEFNELRADEFCDSVRDGTHDSPKQTQDGYKLITSKHIKENELDIENAYYISEEDYEKANQRSKVDINDILYSMIGTIGLIYRVKEEPNYAIKNMGLFKISDELKSKWLYYYLKSPEMVNYIQTLLTGSTQKYVTLKNLRELPIKFPKNRLLAEKIVKFLDNIDEKIELNNKINSDLYEFSINYINNKKEDEEVPVGNLAKIQGGFAFKSKDLIDNKTNNRIIKIKNLRSEINADVLNSQFVEDNVANSVDGKFELHKGDVAIAMTGAELGKTGFIYGFDKYYLNQRVAVIRGKTKQKEQYLRLLFLSDEFQTLLNSKGYGSAQPNISTTDIENIAINNITDDNLNDIYIKLSPIYNKIIENCEENLDLKDMRDTLLPKIMNGEIDLEKINI